MKCVIFKKFPIINFTILKKINQKYLEEHSIFSYYLKLDQFFKDLAKDPTFLKITDDYLLSLGKDSVRLFNFSAWKTDTLINEKIDCFYFNKVLTTVHKYKVVVHYTPNFAKKQDYFDNFHEKQKSSISIKSVSIFNNRLMINYNNTFTAFDIHHTRYLGGIHLADGNLIFANYIKKNHTFLLGADNGLFIHKCENLELDAQTLFNETIIQYDLKETTLFALTKTKIYLVNALSGEIINTIHLVSSITAWIVEKSNIIMACQDLTIKIWNLDQKKIISTFEGNGHAEVINLLSLSPNGYLLSCSSDKIIKFWNLSKILEAERENVL